MKSYAYDMAGVRSGKTVTTTNASTGATTTTHYKYTTLSGKLTRLEYKDREIDFIYDEDGRPYAMVYESSTKPKCVYYYILNAQGESYEAGMPLVIAGKKGAEAIETKGLKM